MSLGLGKNLRCDRLGMDARVEVEENGWNSCRRVGRGTVSI
jgi:hypothetical protein